MAYSPENLSQLGAVHERFWDLATDPSFPVAYTLTSTPFALLGGDAVRDQTWRVRQEKGYDATWSASINEQPIEIQNTRNWSFEPTTLANGLTVTTIPPQDRFGAKPNPIHYQRSPGREHHWQGTDHNYSLENLAQWCGLGNTQSLMGRFATLIAEAPTHQVFRAEHKIRIIGQGEVAGIKITRTVANGQLVNRGLRVALGGLLELNTLLAEPQDETPQLTEFSYSSKDIQTTSDSDTVSERILRQAVRVGNLIVKDAELMLAGAHRA